MTNYDNFCSGCKRAENDCECESSARASAVPLADTCHPVNVEYSKDTSRFRDGTHYFWTVTYPASSERVAIKEIDLAVGKLAEMQEKYAEYMEIQDLRDFAEKAKEGKLVS